MSLLFWSDFWGSLHIAKKTNCKIIGVDIEDLVINIAKKS